MTFVDHKKRSMKHVYMQLLPEELHDKVHKHLDSYFPILRDAHRMIFHHKQGVEHMVHHYGEKARGIAQQHIKDDYQGVLPEGFLDRNYFPAARDAFYLEALAIAEGIYG